MNEYFLQVRSQEKIRELRNEGMTGQEFRRLGGRTRPQLPPASALVALAILLLGILVISALFAFPAMAAPASTGPGVQPCSVNRSTQSLGVDGGLTGLSRGEITIRSVAASSTRPLGVDGGLLSLVFARSGAATLVASAGNACSGAFIPAGG